MARPSMNLGITAEERRELEAMAASRSLPHGLVRRAQMILWSHEGMSLEEIARRARVTPAAVSNWRRRFRQARVAGLHDALKSGRPRALDDERVAQLLSAALLREPMAAPHWTVRALAQETGLAKSSVQRYLTHFGVPPRRPRDRLLSADAGFVARIWDIVGLHLNPPDYVLVLCAQAADSAAGTAQALTSVRESAQDELAVCVTPSLSGGLASARPRKRHQELLTFLRQADATVHASLQVHLIADARTAHRHPRLHAWLKSRPRFTLHAMPSHEIWLAEVERWFGIVIQRALRGGASDSAEALRRRIEDFGACCARHAAPFEWTDSVKRIMQKLLRLNKAISGTTH